MNVPRTATFAALALAAFAICAPTAGATLVDRTVFAEDFGWNT